MKRPRRAARSRRVRAFAEGGTLGARARAIERALERALPRASAPPARLHAAMRYAALAPGKRVRPLLVLASCEALGGDWRRALAAAAALELVHAFSLVHDDLPALDDDDFRRGRPTTHRRFGEAVALLAGDALLALAFETLADLARQRVSAARVAEAQRLLARASGSRELVGGQVLDLQAEGRRTRQAQVRDIHLRKTGALIGASLALGALVAGASRTRVRSMERLGRRLGLAFQIQDDLLNRSASLRQLGKRSGTDAALGKATYPAAFGEARSRRAAAAAFRSARAAIARLGANAQAARRVGGGDRGADAMSERASGSRSTSAALFPHARLRAKLPREREIRMVFPRLAAPIHA